MTMSISSAPFATASRTSASLTARLARPLGKAVATAATLMPVPASASFATPARSPYTQTAATAGQVRSSGSGRRALAASERTLPGVSDPSSVVRSTIEIAVSIAHALAVVLIERVPSTFTRFSAPTWSTPGRPCRNARKASFERVTSANGSGRVPGAALGSASAFGSSTWVMPGILHCWSRVPGPAAAACGTVDHMAPPTRRRPSRRIPWTTAVPLLALVVLAVSWGRHPPTVIAVLIGVVLMGAVLAAVHHAEVVAHRVGEPFGSLVLAVAVTIIEGALIVTLMISGGDDTASLARDTVFAAVMITCNGIVGLSLLLGALRHGVVSFNAEGSGAALATVTTLAVLSLVLPTFTTAESGPEFSPSQLAFAAVASLVLYGAFVLTQTVRHRDFFLPVADDGELLEEDSHAEPPTTRAALTSLALLLVALVAVVGLAKVESPAIEDGVAAVGAPQSFVGVVIALLVLLPETLAAANSARRNRLQTSLNLAFGSAMASIGLTIPVIAAASIWLGGPLVLGLGSTQLVLLAVTVVVAVLTVVPGRATRLQGVVHLALLASFVFLAVNP